MSEPIIYFGPGPAKLPPSVLEEAAAAVREYGGTGLSILELPHRGKAFRDILAESKALVLELCGLDDDYEVLWLQGGGRHQFAMVPMNFLGAGDTAGYIDSGHWSSDAISAAGCYGQVRVLASSRADHYLRLPDWPAVPDDLAYLHITTNNTIYGTQWPSVPACPVPLIADMSSDIFSVQRDYRRYALFYAVAQKNIGPAGVTLVVIRRDMAERIRRRLPDALSYAGQIKADSLLNTAPVFAIYASLLQLRWTKDRGIAAIEAENREKAALLYAAIDRHPLLDAPVAPAARSLMNVIFRAKDAAAEQRFLAQCRAAGIEGIEGHRSAGGFRASLYNPVRLADVERLADQIGNFQ